MRGNCSIHCPRIVPRVIWEMEKADENDLMAILKLIENEMDTYEYDGIVFEITVSAQVLPFIQSLGSVIHQKKGPAGDRHLIVILPPNRCI